MVLETTALAGAKRSLDETPAMVTAVRVVVLLMSGFSIIICSSRIYTRKFITRAFGIDDYCAIAALLFTLGFSALSVTITYYGLGKRQVNVLPLELLGFLKIYYVALCTYLFVASTVKISLAVFLMRIFPTTYIQRTCWAMIIFLVIFAISGELSLVFQCNPVISGYDRTVPGKCYSNDTLFAILMYQGVLMFLADVVLIILPMPIIWHLQMSKQKRLLLLGLFSFGFLACISSLVRFSTLAYTKDTTDYTYSAASSLIWMNLEYHLGLISGSLSSIRPLFTKALFFGTHKDSSTQLSGKGYELGDRGGWNTNRIIMTQEVDVVGETGTNNSKERIVPDSLRF